MRIAMSGSHGLIGSALTEALEARGHTVQPISRTEVPNLSDVEIVINLAGANIAGRRWTESYKHEILSSRLAVTRSIVAALNAEARKGRSLTFVSGSAMGFYGSRGSEDLPEEAPGGGGFLADVCRAWEGEASRADATHRLVVLRTGHVLAPEGGLLAPQRPLFKAGLGGPIGKGLQWQPWIHIDDYVRGVLHVLERDTIAGPVNMAAPHPVRQRDFARAFGQSLGRSGTFPTPELGPTLALGREMTRELLLASQKAVPGVLLDTGFRFEHPEVEEALASLASQNA